MNPLRLVIPLLILALIACEKKPVDPMSSLDSVNVLTANNVEFRANSLGDKILEYGFCWDISANPTIKNNKIPIGAGTGNYTYTLSTLSPTMTYHVRSYCASRLKISYGSDVEFTMLDIPAITTGACTSISTNSFSSGGAVNANGRNIDEAGICWSSSPNPTTANQKSVGSLIAGSFTVAATGLDSNSVYFMRAYINCNGQTFYGNERTVQTFKGIATDIDGNTYYTISIGSQVWMASNLRVKKYRNGNPITYSMAGNAWLNNSNQYTDNGSPSINGYLYDLYCAIDSRSVAPAGWHIPDDNDWNALATYLGGPANAGTKMKSQGYGWNSASGTNESGFSAVAAGRVDFSSGLITDVGNLAAFWSSSYFMNGGNPWVNKFYIYDSGNDLINSGNSPNTLSGFSIRCIKD